MARRRGLSVALQTVLGGLAGGAQGYVQQREMERKRLAEDAALRRQEQLDIATAFERNYQTPEEFARTRDEQKVTEPAQRIRIGEQELVRARTPQMEAAMQEARRTTTAAKQRTQEGKAKSEALQNALSMFPNISLRDRAAISAGLTDLDAVLRRNAPEPGPRSKTMQDVNSEVGQWVRANTGRMRTVVDPETRAQTQRPIRRDELMAEADMLRESLMQLYGIARPSASRATSQATGADSATRPARPLEFTTSSGRTYRLPQE